MVLVSRASRHRHPVGERHLASLVEEKVANTAFHLAVREKPGRSSDNPVGVDFGRCRPQGATWLRSAALRRAPIRRGRLPVGQRLGGLIFSQLAQSLVAIAHDTARPVPRSIVRFIIRRNDFARAISQNVAVHPANDVARSVSDVVVAHIFTISFVLVFFACIATDKGGFPMFRSHFRAVGGSGDAVVGRRPPTSVA